MRGDPRIFLSHTFGDENRNLIDDFDEVAQNAGFEIVTGKAPAQLGPPEHVRSRILSCDCFAAILTSKAGNGKASAWVYNEIGMAYALGLPLIVCKEDNVDEVGLAAFATSYLTFRRDNLKDFRLNLQVLLRELRKSPALVETTTLGSFISGLARAAIQGSTEDVSQKARALEILPKNLDPIIDQVGRRRFAFGESDEFSAKWGQRLEEKRAIADYVVTNHLQPFEEQTEAWIFMDSGTVIYTICEEIVGRALRIPVMTNNLASCRMFSTIPQYPAKIVPGDLDSRYVAALGDDSVTYLSERFANSVRPSQRIEVSIIAATSVTSSLGICGNDGRHKSLKRTALEMSPSSLVVFEGEKLLEHNGTTIFENEVNWAKFAEECHNAVRQVHFITHVPEKFDHLSSAQRKLFESEVKRLRRLFGDKFVTVLSNVN